MAAWQDGWVSSAWRLVIDGSVDLRGCPAYAPIDSPFGHDPNDFLLPVLIGGGGGGGPNPKTQAQKRCPTAGGRDSAATAVPEYTGSHRSCCGGLAASRFMSAVMEALWKDRG